MSDLGDLYQEMILDHSRHPHNYRALENANRKAEGYNPLCGDQITVYLNVQDDRIYDITFEGQGCAICKASASVMTETVKEKTTTQAQDLFVKFHSLVTEGHADQLAADDKMSVFSGVSEYPTRVKCAILAWHTLKSALEGQKAKVSTE
ncbi:MAG TPA: SUF system NifU family Fe-S cluster assembly protein [Elusimicrobiota bacterium]|nr:SUF system NifU family Fe-S cluster assembly protein [Elusimicrobiota bacterium]